MNYFTNCSTVAEIKAHYRILAKENHPDYGGIETDGLDPMQDINIQYHEALKQASGECTGTNEKTGKKHYYYYNQELEQELIDKIKALLALKMIGVEIELIGVWLWVSGNTKEYKAKLKELKCSWHSKRKMWYWRKFDYRRRYSNIDTNTLRDVYGSQTMKEKENSKKLVA